MDQVPDLPGVQVDIDQAFPHQGDEVRDPFIDGDIHHEKTGEDEVDVEKLVVQIIVPVENELEDAKAQEENPHEPQKHPSFYPKSQIQPVPVSHHPTRFPHDFSRAACLAPAPVIKEIITQIMEIASYVRPMEQEAASLK